MSASLHATSQCEKELKAWPGFSWQGVPKTFACSCGRIYRFMDSEADGAWWDMAGFVETNEPQVDATGERPIWLEVRPDPDRMGDAVGVDVALLRDVLITESLGPDDENKVRTAERVRRIALDLPLDGEPTGLIEIVGTNGATRIVKMTAYDWHFAGFAHWPDGNRAPGGSHLLLRILEGLEPGVPKPDLSADQAQAAADVLANYADSLRKRGITL